MDINGVFSSSVTASSLILESCRSTTRELVGLQLWRGGLLLADFICSFPELFRNQNVLELAAGTGFTSLVASQWAHKVICTGEKGVQVMNA